MNTNKYNWILKEKISKNLKEDEIKNIVNKKLAYIIIELEINQTIYFRNKRLRKYEY